jgi:hypothetical protein
MMERMADETPEDGSSEPHVYSGSFDPDAALIGLWKDIAGTVWKALLPNVEPLREQLHDDVAREQLRGILMPIAEQLAKDPRVRDQVVHLGVAQRVSTALPITVVQEDVIQETTTVHSGSVLQTAPAEAPSGGGRRLSMPGPAVVWGATLWGLQSAVADALEGEPEEFIRSVVLTLVALLLLLVVDDAPKRD